MSQSVSTPSPPRKAGKMLHGKGLSSLQYVQIILNFMDCVHTTVWHSWECLLGHSKTPKYSRHLPRLPYASPFFGHLLRIGTPDFVQNWNVSLGYDPRTSENTKIVVAFSMNAILVTFFRTLLTDRDSRFRRKRRCVAWPSSLSEIVRCILSRSSAFLLN